MSLPTRYLKTALIALCILLVPLTLRAQDDNANRQLIGEVTRRLLSVTTPVTGIQWPPIVELLPGDSVNACATFVEDGTKQIPKVIIYRGLLDKAIEGDADRLAFVLAHELSHIILGHTRSSKGPERTTFLQSTYTREQELAADQKGMQLTLAAGFSYRRALKGIQRMLEFGLDYSSFEGLAADHPSWKERLQFLDKEQASLWKAMSAFHDGAVFLTIEQYYPAERCFRNVTKEFPSCYEAWTNLGYALLMQYCDALDTDELKAFGIGQIVCGGFFRRPASLEAQVRGIDEELWWSAVGALREAVRLKPDLALGKANLGLAYLVRPAGKDVGQASKYLQEAVDSAPKDPSLDAVARATILINAGVAAFAAGTTDLSRKEFEEGSRLLTRQDSPQQLSHSSQGVTSALLYNDAFLLATSPEDSARRSSIDLLERYCRTASKASAWWPIAYEKYKELCVAVGKIPKSPEQLQRNNEQPFRLVTTVDIAPKLSITLGEPTSQVRPRLGECQTIPSVNNTNLLRLHYTKYGLDLLVNERILAICLNSEAAPSISVRPSGLGSKASTLKVGMTRNELELILADENYDFRQLLDPETNYRFYRSLGLAVIILDGRVKELVVVIIPERSILGS